MSWRMGLSWQTYARMSVYYLLFFTTIGVFTPYFNLYLQSRGLNTEEVGVVLAVIPLVGIVVQPMWGMMNDVLHLQKLTLFLALLVPAVVLVIFPLLHSFPLYLLATGVLAAFQFVAMPVADSMTVQLAGIGSYGKVRLHGSLGYAAAVAVAAYLYKTRGIGDISIVYVVTAMLAFVGLVLYPKPARPNIADRSPKAGRARATARLRIRRPSRADSINSVGTDDSINRGNEVDNIDTAEPRRTQLGGGTGTMYPKKRSLFTGMRLLLSNRRFVLILAFTLLITTSQAVNNNFFSLYYHALHRPMGLLGVIYALGAVSELPFFFIIGRFIERYGAERILLLGGGIFLMRWIVLSFEPPTWIIVVLQLSHGLSFSLTFAAGVSLAAGASVAESQVTAQTLYNSVNMGMSSIVGSLIGGVVLDSFGPRGIYQFAAAVCIVGLGGMVWLIRSREGLS